MAKAKDLTGQRFGRLVALEHVRINSRKNAMWLCQCDCGNKTIVPSNALTLGHTKSCGCFKKENIKKSLANADWQSKSHKIVDERYGFCGTFIPSLTQKIRKNNKTGVKGVCFDSGVQKYLVQIGVCGKNIKIGYYHTIEEAAKARALAEEKYFQPILEKYETEQKEKAGA